MRQLHPEAIAAIQSKALFSKAEEQLLSKVGSVRLRASKARGVGEPVTWKTDCREAVLPGDLPCRHMYTCGASVDGVLWESQAWLPGWQELSLFPSPDGDWDRGHRW